MQFFTFKILFSINTMQKLANSIIFYIIKNMENDYNKILERLKTSTFRAKFCLKEKDKEYINKKGMETIRAHAYDFINKRLAPAVIENDGKQTPMRGHPVFIAQHATATCCRGCLNKWHNIPKNRKMTDLEVEFVVNLIMKWIESQLKD